MIKNLNSHGKKANILLDIVFVFLIILGSAILGLLGYSIFNDINTDLQADNSLDAAAKAIPQNLFDRYPAVIDGGFLFMIGLLWIFLLVSTALVDAHPMFLVVSVILLLFAMGAVLLMGNVFEELTSDSDFAASVNQFPIITWIMAHIFEVMFVQGASVLIVLYAKMRVAQ